MKKATYRLVYWIPRILSIIFIIFLALFSLDVFDSTSRPVDIAIGLFMHNIPSLILLVVLIISWKHELVGGVVFILAGFIYMALIARSVLANPADWYMFFWTLPISLPAFSIGILFWLGWRNKKSDTGDSTRPE